MKIAKFLNLLLVFILLWLNNIGNAQSGIEYQFIKYPNSQDLLIKWSEDINFPIVEVSTKYGKKSPSSVSRKSATFRNVDFLNKEIVKVKYSKGDGESYTLEVPINELTGGVHTTNSVYDVINPWTNSATSMVSELSQSTNLDPIEIYSFLQQFWKISDESMHKLVGSRPAIPTLREVAIDLSLLISRGGPNGPTSDGCNCKLIITNSSALNRPNENNTAEGIECSLASPVDKGQNIDNGNDEDELVWTSQLGASKGFLFFIQADGADDIGTKTNPDRFSLPATSFSRIRYKVVCANPLSQKPNNECKCSKSVDLEWEYASNYHWSVNDGWHVYGSDNSIYLEDWALAVLSLPNNNSEILDRGMINKRGACDSEPLTSTFTTLTEVATNVQTAINNPTITSVITGATGVLNFFGAVSSLAECNSKRDSTVTLLRGSKQDIELKPGEELMFSIISGCTLGGHVRNNGRSTARIVSEGYVAGVLHSTSGGSEGCCNDEKIGSYALGSLSDFSFSEVTSIEKPNRSVLQSSLNDGIFNGSSPMGGFSSVGSTVASFIGVNGPWGGVFDPSGCCDDVVIDCYSRCGIYRKCEIVGKILSENDHKITKQLENRIKNENVQPLKTDDLSILERKSFPNPNNGDAIFIELDENDTFDKVIIFEPTGKQYEIQKWSRNANIIEINPINNIPNGLIIIMLINESKNNAYYSKIIKI